MLINRVFSYLIFPFLAVVISEINADFFDSGDDSPSKIDPELIDRIKAAKSRSAQPLPNPFAVRSARKIEPSSRSFFNEPDTTNESEDDEEEDNDDETIESTTHRTNNIKSNLVGLLNPFRPKMSTSLNGEFSTLNEAAINQLQEKARAFAALNAGKFSNVRPTKARLTTPTTTTTTTDTTTTDTPTKRRRNRKTRPPTTTMTTKTTTPEEEEEFEDVEEDETTTQAPKRNQKTAGQLAANENEGDKKTFIVGKHAAKVEELTKTLVAKHGIPSSQISQLPLIAAFNTVKQDCLTKAEEAPKVSLDDPFSGKLPECAQLKFRSFDGTCNNIAFPDRGSTSTTFLRLLEPDYSDSIAAPRKSKKGRELPSARLVSKRIAGQDDSPSTSTTLAFMQFGQLIDHDITNTPKAKGADKLPPQCCFDDPNTKLDVACYPIPIPADDPFLAKHKQTCMEFVRSAPGTRPGCTVGVREQINQNTAYIDGSVIYGQSRAKAESLRTMKNGQLTTFAPSNNPHYHLLPQNPKNAECIDPTETKMCFKAGDPRANVHLGIAQFQTLWLRQHNFVAKKLKDINPQWGDEKLFQEARHIVAAQLQHITYAEFLPILLGKELLEKFNLKVLESGRFQGYNISIHPGILNEFAGAAYRVGHTMVPNSFKRMSSDFKFRGTEGLKSTFFHPFALYDKDAFDEIILGMVASPTQEIDNNFVDDLVDHLFEIPGDAFGLDLTALNVQRGRDHGLPGWMKWRALCGLPTASTFDELRKLGALTDDLIDRMEEHYDDVADIDLYIAGTAENHVPGGKVGPTFACLIGEQFRRLRLGDRYWYENDLPLSSSLSDNQVDEIRKTTMARVFCDNTPLMEAVQPKSFLLSNPQTNPVTPCSKIISPDFTKWRAKKSLEEDEEEEE